MTFHGGRYGYFLELHIAKTAKALLKYNETHSGAGFQKFTLDYLTNNSVSFTLVTSVSELRHLPPSAMVCESPT